MAPRRAEQYRRETGVDGTEGAGERAVGVDPVSCICGRRAGKLEHGSNYGTAAGPISVRDGPPWVEASSSGSSVSGTTVCDGTPRRLDWLCAEKSFV